MKHVTQANFANKLRGALPEFVAYSEDFRDYLAGEGWFYGVGCDFGSHLLTLLDQGDERACRRYFAFLNKWLASTDEYLLHVAWEGVIERLALISEFYYKKSLRYLSSQGAELLRLCKANPPIGQLPPPW
ncbi:hypothetical protein ACFST9_00305 [Hymenobacter monticola]|uniref:DUF7674 domain-containing protein n=1 Tax=Hymenobacter monticola TaxID=1705399 RepID=A0ABY4BGC6_9BACT|nr:hypothetical protein [Hymenobacter monticola]UOE36796.1 hypothetical protein MTP16_25300 [Hymenobacter monticola]